MGRPKVVNEDYRDRLKELVSHSPREYGYPFQRWTGNWLKKQLAKEFGVNVSDRYINYLLKEMGLSTRTQPASQTNSEPEDSITIRDLQSAQTADFLLLSNPIDSELHSKK